MSESTAFLVLPEDGSRLEQLQALYTETKARADEAAAAHKAVTDALKLELTQRAPEGSRRVVLGGDAGPRLALAYSERRTVDTKRLRAEQPAVYDAYLQVGGSWSLREAKGDE